MADLQSRQEIVWIWDLNDPSGPAQVQVANVTAREWMARDSRYVENLSGQTPGPKVGLNRIIIDSRVSRDR